ncbi:Nucleotide-sugar transporter [Musa troglodytarum]|uniref:Nucleotide-sugar transporter n=1 Tax=Musa troglodytarum TaxID=320322 RepID=A0A9E7GTE2_9LILI|nr:Nucleotide-sugar transporter [Musa troglodytarum]
MALLLTMVLSIFFFSFKPTLQLLLGIIICMISLHMYFAPAQTLVDLPATTNLALDTLKEIAAEQRGES